MNKLSLSDGEWKLMNLLWDESPQRYQCREESENPQRYSV